jgi:hypothetical protein
LRRPAILPVPATPLRLALGAFAEELLLGGQRVMPRAALESGFRFAHPDIDAALGAIVGRARSRPTTASIDVSGADRAARLFHQSSPDDFRTMVSETERR